MIVSSALVVKNYTNNLLIQSIFNKNTDKTTNTITDLTSKLLTREDSKDISDMAANLSTLNKKLESTGNKKAVDGLKYVAKHFISDIKGFNSFKETIENLDSKNFQKVFSTIDKLGDNGLNVDKWIDTFSSISDEDLQKDFLNITNQILSDKFSVSSQKDTLTKLISTVNKVQNGDYEDKDTKLSSLFTSVAKSNNLTDMKAVISIFNKSLIE